MKFSNINYFSAEHEDLIKSGIEIFKERPLIGSGVKTHYETCNKLKLEKNINFVCSTHPHNTYIQLLSDTGILSAFIFAFTFLYVIYFNVKIFFKKNINNIFASFYVLNIGIILNLMPFIPSGSIYNNWINIMIYFPIGYWFYLYSKLKKKVLRLNKYIFFKHFLFLGWILLWGSLSFNPEKLYLIKNFELLNKSILIIFDFLRGISTLIYSVILLFIIFFFIKIFFIKNKTSQYIFVFLLLIANFFLQAIPYYYTGFPIQNLYFLTNSILSSLILFVLFQYYEKRDLSVILYINFIFLILICSYFGFEYVWSFLHSNYNFYNTWGNINNNFIDIPRPTGLSRSFLIIFIILYFLKTKSKKILIFKKILETLCVLFILMLSSRTTSFLFLIFIIANFFSLKKIKKKY